MFVGLNSRTNQRVYIEDAIKEPNEEYICPICKNRLIIRNGSINISHFAHKTNSECDSFTTDMSQWHKDWQNLFPVRNQEVILSLDITERDYVLDAWNYSFTDMSYYEHEDYVLDNIETNIPKHIEHRADVLACGYVIEFQHSPISAKEFNERNWFYTSCGYKVVWIFDFIDKYQSEQMFVTDEWHGKNDNGAKYKWNNAVKTFKDFIPQEHRPQYIENKWWKGDIMLFFQICDENDNEDGYIEKVIWAIEDEYDGEAKFKRFMTSYYPGNKQEFKEYIVKRKL